MLHSGWFWLDCKSFSGEPSALSSLVFVNGHNKNEII